MDRVAAVNVGGFGPLVVALVPAVAVVQSVRLARRHYRNQARRRAVEAWGEAHGLEPDEERPYLRGTRLDVFALLGTHGTDAALVGSWRGVTVHVADYWVAESIGRYGNLLGSPYRRYSVAVVPLDLDLPHLRIDHETPVGGTVNEVLDIDVQFESADFNRRFQVRSTSRAFAFKLLDARLLGWLLETAGAHRFEVAGRWVVAYAPPVPVEAFGDLVDAVVGFVERIPRAVHAEYRATVRPPTFRR